MGVAFAKSDVVIAVWGGCLAVYSLLLTAELWPVQHYHDLGTFSSLPPIFERHFLRVQNHQRRLTLWRPTEAPTATSCAYF